MNYLCKNVFTVILIFFLKVDKHIRKLDSDLARFESDLKEQHAKETGISEFEAGRFSVDCLSR